VTAEVTPVKRALFLVITDYPGGAERVTFNLAGELSSKPGWAVEVMVVCSQLPDSFSKRVLPTTVQVRYGRFRNWFLAFPLLPLRLLLRRYDLVFTTHIYASALLSMLRRMRLLRVRRHVARESTSVFDRSAGLKRRLFGRLYRAYGREELLIAQTGYMAEHIRPWLPTPSASRIRVLPNPVSKAAIDLAVREPLAPELKERLDGHCNILFCGRLIPVKQPQIALAAFEWLAARAGSSQLVVLGDGPLKEEMRHLAVRSGLAERVLFISQRANPYPVMAACHYGLLTSAREGFPNIVLEMMASGLRKVVVTPCAGDLDQLTGVTVTKSFDPSEIGAQLCAAIEAGEDRRQSYQAVVASRSVSAYLDAVLGPAAAPAGLD
jgi:glycosyltransferase involved in cell wall biosynthesis